MADLISLQAPRLQHLQHVKIGFDSAVYINKQESVLFNDDGRQAST